MSNTGSSVNSQAVANAMAGEKTFSRVEFPLTGDAELDMIAGCLAVANFTEMGASYKARVFVYLSERFGKLAREHDEAVEAARRDRENWQRVGGLSQQAATGSGIAGPFTAPVAAGTPLTAGLGGMLYPAHTGMANALPDDRPDRHVPMTLDGLEIDMRRKMAESDLKSLLARVDDTAKQIRP